MSQPHEQGAQGYTDEVAVEAHDLMQQAEEEEERVRLPIVKEHPRSCANTFKAAS